MIEQTPLEQFKETTGRSYSRLSKLAEGPLSYMASLVGDVTSPAASLGSAVDLLLTDKDNFDKEIYVMSATKPGSEMMLKYCQVLAETEDYNLAFQASGYKQEVSESKFKKEGKAYYEALKQAGDRKILDVEDMFRANQMVNNIKNNQFTKKYFVPNKDTELLYQVPIVWKEVIPTVDDPDKALEHTFKAIIDIVEIRHDIRTITPIDLKTGEDSFRKSYFRYKRYLQGAIYYMGLLYAMDGDYTVMNSKFIYADTKLLRPPVIYTMNDSDIEGGVNGVKYAITTNIPKKTIFYITHDEKLKDTFKHKGYKQLAAELEWHERNDKWDYSYDVYQNYGEIEIDAFNIKL
jgi:hypothetical protein